MYLLNIYHVGQTRKLLGNRDFVTHNVNLNLNGTVIDLTS